MKLDVETIAPVHGKPVPWSTFVSALGARRWIAGEIARIGRYHDEGTVLAGPASSLSS